MVENDFGAQYQPCRFDTFLGFDSDYHPDLYGDMAITAKQKNCGPSKVVSFDSEGPSYSTKVPSDLFLTYGIMFKKTSDAKENHRRPCYSVRRITLNFFDAQVFRT